MPQGPKSPRLVTRISVRVRREGGSLSMTIPRYIVRHWKLEPGVRLVVRSTDRGILLYPRYFIPYVAGDGDTASTTPGGVPTEVSDPVSRPAGIAPPQP
jgi:hypothetical protein